MKVYLIAMTRLEKGWANFLCDLGHREWVDLDDSCVDLLVETAGRLCYKSWAPNVNPNVTKVRHGNEKYIENILSSGHGSVLEHVNFTFLVSGVSRVFTHELVRHRAGMAYSQESLRYCRLENLQIVIPKGALPIPNSHEEKDRQSKAHLIINETTVAIRMAIDNLNELLLTDKLSFNDKKQITSLIRRIAPIGISTSIMFTANARALRHLIQQRTSRHAEVEIRQVFGEIASIAIKKAPHIFQDMIGVNGEYTFKYPKV